MHASVIDCPYAVVDAIPASDHHALVMKSTVPVGTGLAIRRIFTDQGKTQTAHHERLDEQGNWVPSMEVTLTKVK